MIYKNWMICAYHFRKPPGTITIHLSHLSHPGKSRSTVYIQGCSKIPTTWNPEDKSSSSGTGGMMGSKIFMKKHLCLCLIYLSNLI